MVATASLSRRGGWPRNGWRQGWSAPRARSLVIWPPLRRLVAKETPDRDQVLGKQTRARPEPANVALLAYISWYINGYGRS